LTTTIASPSPTPASTAPAARSAVAPPLGPLPEDDAPLEAWIGVYTAAGWPVCGLHGLRRVLYRLTGELITVCGCGRPAPRPELDPARACPTPGKHPLSDRVLGFLHGLHDATTDPDRLRALARRHPGMHLAGRTGARPAGNGTVVLDVDPRHGGDDSLADLERRYGRSPATPETLTGGGGRHRYYLHPGPDYHIGNLQTRPDLLGPGLDLRADGGYAVLPPSGHASGRAYTWEWSSRPDELPLARLPDWLLERLTTPGRAERAGRAGGAREPWVAEALGRGAPEGRRNDVAFQLAAYFRHYDLPHDVAEAIVLGFAQRCAPALDEGEALACVASAYGRYEPGRRPAPAAPVVIDL
jgi:hypothetical protein